MLFHMHKDHSLNNIGVKNVITGTKDIPATHTNTNFKSYSLIQKIKINPLSLG